jgi:DNA polymerase IV (archaeal DinB-like DNA polymerase)
MVCNIILILSYTYLKPFDHLSAKFAVIPILTPNKNDTKGWIFLHVDFDSFFASVEVKEKMELKGFL